MRNRTWLEAAWETWQRAHPGEDFGLFLFDTLSPAECCDIMERYDQCGADWELAAWVLKVWAASDEPPF